MTGATPTLAKLRVHPAHAAEVASDGVVVTALTPQTASLTLSGGGDAYHMHRDRASNAQPTAGNGLSALRVSLDEPANALVIRNSHEVSDGKDVLAEIPLTFTALRKHDHKDRSTGGRVEGARIVLSLTVATDASEKSEVQREGVVGGKTWLLCFDGDDWQADKLVSHLGERGAVCFDFSRRYDTESLACRSMAGFHRVHPKSRTGMGKVINSKVLKLAGGELAQEDGLAAKFVSTANVDALKRELSIFVAAQSHPNVAKLHGVFCSHESSRHDDETEIVGMLDHRDATWSVVFEGSSRSLFLDICKQSLKESDVRQVARSVGSALQHLHAMDIVVGDVTADNVLIDSSGRAFLASFGAALFGKDKNMLVRACASPGYGAPEVLLGLESMCGTPIDMFSYGVMIYFALSQTMPFSGSTLASLFKKTVKCNVVFNSTAFRSESCTRFLKSLLQRKPHQRWKASDALASAWLDESSTAEGLSSRDDAADQFSSSSVVEFIGSKPATSGPCERSSSKDATGIADSTSDAFSEAMRQADFMQVFTNDSDLPLISLETTDPDSLDEPELSDEEDASDEQEHVKEKTAFIEPVVPSPPAGPSKARMPPGFARQRLKWLLNMTGAKEITTCPENPKKQDGSGHTITARATRIAMRAPISSTLLQAKAPTGAPPAAKGRPRRYLVDTSSSQ